MFMNLSHIEKSVQLHLICVTYVSKNALMMELLLAQFGNETVSVEGKNMSQKVLSWLI